MKSIMLYILVITIFLSILIGSYIWISSLTLEEINTLMYGFSFVCVIVFTFSFSKGYVEMKKQEEKIKFLKVEEMFWKLDKRLNFLEGKNNEENIN